MYKLVICDDEGKTTVVPLIRDKITIGRKAGNTIRLTDRNVSRHHATLKRSENAFIIEDLGSLAGTKVRTDLLRSETSEVKPNDQIMIGDYSVSIRTNVSAEVPLGRQINANDNSSIGKITPHSRLVVIKGPQVGREIDLVADLYVVGRSDEANCRLPNPSISRAHARIDREGNHWTISDLDSNAGIEINGFKKDDYVLKAGDIISLGNVQLRYVAPGEPYEFVAPAGMSPPPIPKKAALKKAGPSPLFVVGTVVALCVVAIISALLLSSSSWFNETPSSLEDEPQSATDNKLTFDQLMETGKDKIQTEEWSEAARFFALALQESPGNVGAQDMKRLAIAESDAQNAFSQSLAAFEEKKWEQALTHLESIPRSSHYYDDQQIRLTVQKQCQALLTKGRIAIRTGYLEDVEKVLEQINSLSDPPEKCLQGRNAIHIESQKVQQAHGTPSRPSDEAALSLPKQGKPDGFKPVENKKNLPGKNKVNSVTKAKQKVSSDPIAMARAAMAKKDTQGAISILERSGNKRGVLALLATLYKQKGNKAAYDRIANKFVRLYPTDPKTPQFKRNLGK